MVRLALAGTVLAALLAGCQAPAPARVTPPAPAGLPAADAMTDTLQDAWVTDGRRGYFVDAGGPAPAFSLYDTTWWLRMAGTRPGAGLDAAAVQRWVTPAFSGTLPGSPLPPIAQVDHAVTVLRAAGGRIPADRVLATLQTLRRDTGYAGSPTAPGPDWGSTAIAVRLLAGLGQPVPDEVRRATQQALDGTPEVSHLVPLLEIGAALHLPGLAEPVQRAAGELARTRTDAAWLAMRATTADVASKLGVSLPPVPPRTCAGLTGRAGTVALPGQPAMDPQATFYAVRLGCAAVPARPAYSRAGWPERGARAAAPGASAAGLRAALDLHLGARFTAALDRQVREVWVPAARKRPAGGTGPVTGTGPPAGTGPAAGTDLDDTVARIGIRATAVALGPATAAYVTARVPLPAAAGDTADDVALLSEVTELTFVRPAPARLAALSSRITAGGRSSASPVHAAALAVAAEVLHRPALHAAARAEIATLRQAPAVYGGSLAASIVGVWLERPRVDVLAAWAAAGLCPPAGCGAAPGSLRTVAVLLACAHGRYDDLFPLQL